MKKYLIFIALFALYLLAGCQNDKQTKNQTGYAQSTAGYPTQIKNKHNNSSTKQQTISITPSNQKNPIGIKVEDDKIIIDTKQTKDFLNSIAQKLDNGFKKIENNLRKNSVKSPNETGIIITNNKMQIDLNKSKKFMEKWMKSMENVARELNETMKDIEKSLPKY